jgi:hypothetical protein
MLRSWKIVYSCQSCGNSVTLNMTPGPDQDGTQQKAVTVPDLRCTGCDHLPLMAQSSPELVEPNRIIQPSLVAPPMRVGGS